MADLEASRERLLLAADGDWPYRRQLTDIEAASGVDVPDLDHAGQLALERMLAAWHPMRQQHVAELIRQVRAAVDAHPPGDTTWIGTLNLPALNVARLVAGVEAGIDAGHALALAEAARQAPQLAARAADAKRADHTARIHAYALGAERLLAGGLVQTASREAFRLTATTSQVDTAGHVEVVLGDQAMLYERDVLQGMATGAVTEGRYEVMEAVLGERTSQLEAAGPDTYTVYALEILDGNTCDECAAIDGQDYATLDEARVDYPGIGGGYVACAGRERCRGTLVIVYPSEEAPTLTTPNTPPPPVVPPVVVPPVVLPPPPPPPAPAPPVVPPAEDAALAKALDALRAHGEAERAAAPVVPHLDDVMAKGVAIHTDVLARIAKVHAEKTAAGGRLSDKDWRIATQGALRDAGVDLAEPGTLDYATAAPGSSSALTDLNVQQIDRATGFFPRHWVEASNDLGDVLEGPINIMAQPGRAGYDPALVPGAGGQLVRLLGKTPGTIAVEPAGPHSVVVHELAHRMEQAVPGITELEGEWKALRVQASRVPRDATGAHNMPHYPKDEFFLEDDFAIFYTGKVYDSQAAYGTEFHEVLSMGIEALSGANSRTTDWSAARRDDGHMRFVLGLLASL